MKSTLQNRAFLLKVSVLLLILFLGYVVESKKSNSLRTSSEFNQATMLEKTNIRQFIDNKWFTHQTR
ncbi:MAG: hypothetical protein H7259_00155 [Cytophagales bacterium]|nr:hypothetical protein [Cytophaga sp.]